MRDFYDAEHVCTECNAVMKKDTMTIEGMKIRVWKCKQCEETALHPDDAQQMLVFNKMKKGIPVKVGVLGESLIMRFPKEVAEFYNITKGGEIILKADSKKKLEIDVG